MIISIISIILLIILSVILLLLYNNKKKTLNNQFIEQCDKLFNQQLENRKEQLEQQAEEYRETVLRKCEEWRQAQVAERERVEKSLVERKKAVEEIIEQLECRRREAEKSYQAAIAKEHEKIDIELEGYRKNKQEVLNTALTGEFAEKRRILKEEYEAFSTQLAADLAKAREELLVVTEELDEYKKKQAAYNEEILRRREVEEKQDFYRVVLSETDKQDIKYLLSIIDNIKNPTLLYKLIWSEYIQKPFSTTLKNITQGKEIKCVIYKITNIKTKEAYIGKTKADVTKRWTEHIKTSLNIGTVAKSRIHSALYKHWDEFTFEILEIVEDETKLSSREKYYINFYETNVYGYNMNSGG